MLLFINLAKGKAEGARGDEEGAEREGEKEWLQKLLF